MGYDRVTFEGSARLSRHNSLSDRQDNSRWNDLCARLRALEDEFEDIEVSVFAYPIDGDPEPPAYPIMDVAIRELAADAREIVRRRDLTQIVRACPLCGTEVQNTCGHDGVDYHAMDMELGLSLYLRGEGPIPRQGADR